MSKNIKTFADTNAITAAVASDFANLVQDTLAGQEKVTVALSGGEEAKAFYRQLASEYGDKLDWNRVHFFWSDESCVPATDDESHFGAAKNELFSKIQIDDANIHAVRGDDDPDEERSRYENEIYEHVEIDDNAIPQFDLVVLGMGADGHTASIFPHQMQFMKSDRVCEVAIHPETAQKRITLSGPVLNGAHRIACLVTGNDKAAVLNQVVNKEGDYEQFPIAHIDVEDTVFYVDEAANH